MVGLLHAVHLMKSCHFLCLFFPFFSSFFAVTVFLNQNVSHYVSFLTNKRCFCLSNLINLGPQTLETRLMTVTSDMTNSSPSNLSCINAL